jgi:hypothetical protein
MKNEKWKVKIEKRTMDKERLMIKKNAHTIFHFLFTIILGLTEKNEIFVKNI